MITNIIVFEAVETKIGAGGGSENRKDENPNEKERKEFIGRTAMKKKGTVAKGKQQVYKKEIK